MMMYRIMQQICPCPGNECNPLVLLAVIAGTGLLIQWLHGIIKKGGPHVMDKLMKIAIVAALSVGVVVAVAVRTNRSGGKATAELGPDRLTGKGRPALIDLGADTCIPCKLMAPVLDSLKTEYAGALDVHFINLNQNPGAGALYHISVMPTQVFYDASGKELFRHEGFFAKEDILAKWKELGVSLSLPK
jgi:thioredoxin 1